MTKEISTKKPLTGFHLKITALLCMIIDHTAYALAVTPHLAYDLMRSIGRVAFPIYAFLAAEGCRHTKSRERYLLRLGLLALVSEIPFDLAFNGGEIHFLSSTNVFYTLFFAVASIHIYETLRRRNRSFQLLGTGFCAVFILLCWLMVQFITGGSAYYVMAAVFLYLTFLLLVCGYLRQKYEENSTGNWLSTILPVIPILPILFLAQIIGCDYEGFGVALILCIYIAGNRRKQIAVLGASVVYEYGILPALEILRYDSAVILADVLFLVFALAAVLLVIFYNGQRGKNVKWAFYWAYPVHIAILAILKFL